jgi:hypothetical protein
MEEPYFLSTELLISFLILANDPDKLRAAKLFARQPSSGG